MLRRHFAISVLLLLSAIPACKEYRYEINMRRNADGSVRRELRYFVGDAGNKNLSPAELPEQAIEQYENAAATTVGKTPRQAAGDFVGALPTDVQLQVLHNFGATGNSHSPLGEVFVYRERGPGGNRPYANLRTIERMLDTAISAWLAYAAAQRDVELDQKQLAALENLLRTKVHDDVLDLGLIYWPHLDAIAQAKDEMDSALLGALTQRSVLFLIERGYLSPTVVVGNHDSEWMFYCFEGLLRMIQGELGGDPHGPLHPALARLLENDAGDAFEQGLCALGLTHDDFSQMLTREMEISVLGDSLKMSVCWQGMDLPIATNGEWDSTTRELRWSTEAVYEPLLPKVFFAIWVTPNEAEQRRLFGDVRVRGALPSYNEWYQRLSQSVQEKWDAYLAESSPEYSTASRMRVLINRYEGQQLTTEQREFLMGARILLPDLDPPDESKQKN